MFHKVIVGVDGREGGHAAVGLARTLAPADAIVLVNAYPFESAASRALVLGYGGRLREDAERCLKAVAVEAGLDPHALEVRPDTSPARALHRSAEEHRADVIVVGSAHHGRFGRVRLGDVARAVLHDAPCPVLVAPLGFQQTDLAVVGVGFDDSPEARAALRFAAEVASWLGARLRVVSVVDDRLPVWNAGAYAPDMDGVVAALRDEAAERLTAAVTELATPAETDVVVGAPAGVLADLAREVDLVVVGSRGWGPVRRTLLGSTSDRLMHHAACPVLVVPRSVAVEEPRAPGAVVSAHA